MLILLIILGSFPHLWVIKELSCKFDTSAITDSSKKKNPQKPHWFIKFNKPLEYVFSKKFTNPRLSNARLSNQHRIKCHRLATETAIKDFFSYRRSVLFAFSKKDFLVKLVKLTALHVPIKSSLVDFENFLLNIHHVFLISWIVFGNRILRCKKIFIFIFFFFCFKECQVFTSKRTWFGE